MSTLTVPSMSGTTQVTLGTGCTLPTQAKAATSRSVFAAAHVVADPLHAHDDAEQPAAIDWDATLRVRQRLWDLGLGVAEAMDTAQRGAGMPWSSTQELLRRTIAAAGPGDQVAAGVMTDHVPADQDVDLPGVVAAYTEQLEFVSGQGAQPVIMASRHLARVARSAEQYRSVYEQVLSQASGPVFLHWLGEAFDPALRGYWGALDPADALDSVVSLIADNVEKVAGIKVSVLDPAVEKALRDRLPESVRTYTGDDFHYVDLIAGDNEGHSDALLGAFSVVPQQASAAILALDDGDVDTFREILEPTVPLSRIIFEAPTSAYKVGVAWMAYLQGEQTHFRMVNGFESRRSIAHLIAVFEAANQANIFRDPEAAAGRLRALLDLHGLA